MPISVTGLCEVWWSRVDGSLSHFAWPSACMEHGASISDRQADHILLLPSTPHSSSPTLWVDLEQGLCGADGGALLAQHQQYYNDGNHCSCKRGGHASMVGWWWECKRCKGSATTRCRSQRLFAVSCEHAAHAHQHTAHGTRTLPALHGCRHASAPVKRPVRAARKGAAFWNTESLGLTVDTTQAGPTDLTICGQGHVCCMDGCGHACACALRKAEWKHNLSTMLYDAPCAPSD